MLNLKLDQQLDRRRGTLNTCAFHVITRNYYHVIKDCFIRYRPLLQMFRAIKMYYKV